MKHNKSTLSPLTPTRGYSFVTDAEFRNVVIQVQVMSTQNQNFETYTFLSTSVRTLLNCANFTPVSTDLSREYLTNNNTFNWESIGILLDDGSESSEPLELALRSKTWFVETIKALAPVLVTAELLCQKAATDTSAQSHLYSLWKWTDRAEELSKCLSNTFGPSPNRTAAVESTLIISATLERALGNILRQKDLPVPFLLRDLLLEKTLHDTLGDVPVKFTRLLVGMPAALNARNLVWHGFIAPCELSLRIPATLLILLASLGEILKGFEIPFYKTSPSLSGIEDLPRVEVNVDGFRSSLGGCSVIPRPFLPFWEDAFQRFTEEQFGRCLILLLPQLELVLRIGFCVSNDCPKRLLTAVQSSPHTTLDDMLVETTGDKPNNLCKKLGDGVLNALFDLLQRPSGPRIRDRLGHGECSLNDISQNLAAVLLSLSMTVAARLSQCQFSQMPFWDSYKARFHPVALLLKTGHDVLDHIEKLQEVTHSSVFVDNLNIVDSLEKALTDGDAREAARQSLNADAFWNTTLFRPRQEIITTVAMLRSLRSVCVALEATKSEISRRSFEEAEGRLRSRQRKTLERMVQIIPTVTKTATCLVIMAVQIRNTLANNPSDYAKWQRCVSQMEKYTEKLSAYVQGTKNRWEEVKCLTASFCDTVLPFCSYDMICDHNRKNAIK